MSIFRVIGQIITWSSLVLLVVNLIYMQIPGYGGVCDAEQIFLFANWGLFILVSILTVINSVLFYKRKYWVKYRLISIFFIIGLFLVLFTLRPISTALIYGQESVLIENVNEDGLMVDLRLYENGKFFSRTYDLSCQDETIGIYTITDDILELECNESSEYLGARFEIVGNQLNSLDSAVILRIKN